MSIFGKYKDFGKNAEIVTRRYRGPDRRDPGQAEDPTPASPEADTNTQSDKPRRRAGDQTTDRDTEA